MLGGFPVDDHFRNYTADASTFVVTYPLNSKPDNRCWSRGRRCPPHAARLLLSSCLGHT